MVGTLVSSQRILDQVWAGSPLVILDDRRELEGDIFCAAEVATAEVLQLMVRKASGLLCMAMPRTQLEGMGIPRLSEMITKMYLLADQVEDRHMLSKAETRFLLSIYTRMGDTPFHFPVDVRGQPSGISVVERLETIQALLSPHASIDDFDVPGHLFTLGAHPDGLRGRGGHTEAAVDLAVAAGLKPAGLLCEVVGDEGEMLRGDELEAFARAHEIEVLPISRIPEIQRELGNGQIQSARRE